MLLFRVFPAFRENVSVLDFSQCFKLFILNVESIYKQKQYLIDVLYFIAKEIMKMDLKSGGFFFLVFFF